MGNILKMGGVLIGNDAIINVTSYTIFVTIYNKFNL